MERRPARSKDLIATEPPHAWVGACMAAINNAPNAIASELLGIVSWAVRIERARRLAEAEPVQEKRSALVDHHGRPPNQLHMFKPIYWND